jgi:S1-C subfamily serine protease
LRTMVISLALTATACAALGGCAGETPATSFLPALSTPPVAAPSVIQETREAREAHIIKALTADLSPAAVQGMRQIGTGSGFFIATNHLLTNFHVVDGCRAITVGNNTEGEEVDARLIASDSRADLAVLSADEKDVQPAQFLTGTLAESQDHLAIVGYPEHGRVVLQAELHPIAVFQDDLERSGSRYNFYGTVRRGNSGGPLLNSVGAVVGVVTAKIDTVAVYQKTGAVVDDLGIAIANHTVFAFLTANHIPFEPAMAGADLPPDELLQKAHGFVRQVGCWK